MTVDTEERPASRRDELLRLSARIFAERGFVKTTIRDIAEEANILSGSLYHHFKSKESIVDEILQTYFTRLGEIVESVNRDRSSPAERFSRLTHELLELSASHREATLIYENDSSYLMTMFPYIREGMDTLESAWLKILRAGAKQGAFRSELEPAVVYRMVLGSMSYFARWYRAGGSLSVTEIADQQVALFLRGLSAD